MLEARRKGAPVPYSANTPYLNTIPPDQQPPHPGRPRDRAPHPRLHPLERDGHGAAGQQGAPPSSAATSPASSRRRRSTTIGFNHFWRAPQREPWRRSGLHPGPLLARHLCPRASSRAASPRSSSLNFRQEVDGEGLSLLSASLADAGLLAVPDRVDGPGAADGDLPGALHEVPARTAAWPTPPTARCGRSSATARWTSRRSLGAISLAGREKLDNLIFVVNCNLQRLDGPVRGNGKIIQELEARSSAAPAGTSSR